MQLLVEELEPIVTATETARSLPTFPLSSKEEEEEPRLTCRLNRVAMLCAAQIRSIDRSLVRIGRYVSRLVRHYDRQRGLTALAARITESHGKIVSRQYLRQALCVFEAYSRDETENRFSDLPNTHLLKAAQAFPDLCDRDARNALLDQAVKDKSSVAELATCIKSHRTAKAMADTPESALPTSVTQVEEPRGYICGDGMEEIQILAARSVSFLRVREQVASVSAISHAGQAMSADGLMVVEQSTLEGYIDVSKAVSDIPNLRTVHAFIVLTPSIHRNAPHNLPVNDRFRVIILVGGYGFRFSRAQPKRFDNPISGDVVDELIYSLAPDSGIVVDIGTGSAQTAEWAKAHGREFLAVEPDEAVHAKNLADLEADLSTDTSREPTPPATPDPWPMVSASQRERATSGAASWDDFSCCERTQVAAVVLGVRVMACPVCSKKRTPTLGAQR